MKTSTNGNPAARAATHPPLALNGLGQPVAVPEGTAGWRVKRATAGRPRAVLGPDRQPVRLAIDTTPQELAEMFGAGAYRIEACDEVGEPIDYVTTVTVGEAGEIGESAPAGMRNGAGASGPAAVGSGAELRAALEVIQQLARTNGDALRAVAEAQADYVKSLASAKLIPRNGFMAMAPIAPAARPAEVEEADDDSSDDDGEDEEDDVEEAPSKSRSPLEAIATTAAVAMGPVVIEAVQGLVANPGKLMELLDWRRAAKATPSAPAANPDPAMHLVRVRNRLTHEEARLVDEILRDEDTARVLVKELGALSVDAAVARVRAAMSPVERRRAVDASEESVEEASVAAAPTRDLASHVMAVRALLEPSELMAVMTLLPRLAAAELQALEATLLAMTPADSAAWIRANLAELSKRSAS